MQLNSADGASLELMPIRYEFVGVSSKRAGWDEEWDPNWLVIHGDVRTAEGYLWSFENPSLTTWEARELGAWLREAADGRIAPSDVPTEDSPGLLTFVEPNLALSVASVHDDDLVLRVHLSAEAVADRPVAGPDQWDLYAYHLPLRLSRAHLSTAARDWMDDLKPFPTRGAGRSAD